MRVIDALVSDAGVVNLIYPVVVHPEAAAAAVNLNGVAIAHISAGLGLLVKNRPADVIKDAVFDFKIFGIVHAADAVSAEQGQAEIVKGQVVFHGIKSIDANVGRDYRRIRIGINHPRDFDLKTDAADWVLGRFTDEELKKINTVISELQI